jgi:hypothetical protein
MKPDSNPPLSPFFKIFQRGKVAKRSEKTIFEKEGQGEIYSADF